jgi:hypothetical protein
LANFALLKPFTLLCSSERADSRETQLAVRIPERPGSFRELYECIAPRNVTEFSYRYNTAARADVIVSFQAMGAPSERIEDAARVQDFLTNNGYVVTDLASNELAKVTTMSARHMKLTCCSNNLDSFDLFWPDQVHLRHLVGGRPPAGAVSNEQLYRYGLIGVEAIICPPNAPVRSVYKYLRVHHRRFQFPEAPGALKKFLNALNQVSFLHPALCSLLP